MSKVMPVYVEEALNGTADLDLELAGAYWMLLLKLWSCDGMLKDSDHMVARLLSVNTRKWKRIKSSLLEAGKIELVDGFITNNKLQRTLINVANKSETLRINRESRWSKSLKTIEPVSKSLFVIEDKKIKDSSKTVKVKVDNDADFNLFYQAYPKRIGRGQAVKAYDKAVKVGSVLQILNGAKAYADASKDTDKQYIRHPATWLNGQGWLDELDIKVRELDEAGPLAPVNLKALTL